MSIMLGRNEPTRLLPPNLLLLRRLLKSAKSAAVLSSAVMLKLISPGYVEIPSI
jgi:hypothetical protein